MAITYDPTNNVITVTGYTEGTPCTFEDIWLADIAGTLLLLEEDTYDGDPTPVTLDTDIRPADWGGIRLIFRVDTVDTTGGNPYVEIIGKVTGSEDTGNIIEILSVADIFNFQTTHSFKEIVSIKIYTPGGSSSVTLDIAQDRWGVVSKQGAAQYHFDAKLQIGNGSTQTYFADEEVQVQWADIDTAHYEKIFRVMRKTYLRLGALLDEATKATAKGVTILNHCDNTTPSWHQPGYVIYEEWSNQNDIEVYLYSCHFINPKRSMVVWIPYGTTRLWNCQFNGVSLGDGPTDGLFNVTISYSNNYPFGYARWTGFEQAFAYNCYRLIYTQATYTFNLKNAYSRGHTYIVRPSGWSGTGYFINCDFDSWAIDWAGTSSGTIYRQYEIDIAVTDKDDNPLSGATVTLRDKDGNQVFQVTTEVNGEIATQTVSRGYYDQANGDTLQDYSPHTLTIEKGGYQTYEKRFMLKEKTTWEIKLAKAVGVFLDFGRPVVNLKKSNPENKVVMVL